MSDESSPVLRAQQWLERLAASKQPLFVHGDDLRLLFGELLADLTALRAAHDDCSRKYHAAINEPEYAGSRADWIFRAQYAEAEADKLRAALVRSEDLAKRSSLAYQDCCRRLIAAKKAADAHKAALARVQAVMDDWRQSTRGIVKMVLADLATALAGSAPHEKTDEEKSHTRVDGVPEGEHGDLPRPTTR